ncbi:MAG: class I SAM-dependent methyltransferase [Gammaproteobacteria bacterium]|nr:class I SAM-dependent methyltransferase [Gammaproteobacteria bacterium]MDH5799583.1 class I SAM-dependent methyltransferase [Gammaproteobacteria bacterium]
MESQAHRDKSELIPHPPLQQYYADEQHRRGFVSWLFDETACHYDWIIRAMSFGSGNWYRHKALLRAGLKQDDAMLDIATGTGPVAKAALRIVGPGGSVTGLDRSANMMLEAKKTVQIPFIQSDAAHLPFPDNSFDFLSMGYALRHVDDLHATFDEYLRVLKPGGTVLVMELTRHKSAFVNRFLKFYMRRIVPKIARIGSGTKDAETLMTYFWDTIENCVPPDDIMKAMANSGFLDNRRYCDMGIFSEYVGVKPE